MLHKNNPDNQQNQHATEGSGSPNIARAVLAAMVLTAGFLSSGCCIEYRFCRRCNTRCHVPCQISNCSTQYREHGYSVPRAGVVPAVSSIPPQETTSTNELFDSAEGSGIPAMDPGSSVAGMTPSEGIEVAEIVPEPAETLVEEPVERVADASADAFATEEPAAELAEESQPDEDSSLADSSAAFGQGSPLASVLDRENEANAETLQQDPAESIARPFAGIAKDEANPFDAAAQMPSTALDGSADPFNLQPLPLLRAIPVDKKDQRIAGIPMSTGQENRTLGRSVFRAGPESQLIVLPRRKPTTWQPGLQLEGMDYGLGIDAVSPVAPSEASNEAPGKRDVVR